jgi:hypothetical protein
MRTLPEESANGCRTATGSAPANHATPRRAVRMPRPLHVLLMARDTVTLAACNWRINRQHVGGEVVRGLSACPRPLRCASGGLVQFHSAEDSAYLRASAARVNSG